MDASWRGFGRYRVEPPRDRAAVDGGAPDADVGAAADGAPLLHCRRRRPRAPRDLRAADPVVVAARPRCGLHAAACCAGSSARSTPSNGTVARDRLLPGIDRRRRCICGPISVSACEPGARSAISRACSTSWSMPGRSAHPVDHRAGADDSAATSRCITCRRRSAFWNFRELPALLLNDVVFAEAARVTAGRRVSMVYQRYSLHNFAGLRLAQHLRVPFVLEYNGSEVWMSRHWGRPLKYEALAERIERVNVRAADLVVVVSRADARRAGRARSARRSDSRQPECGRSRAIPARHGWDGGPRAVWRFRGRRSSVSSRRFRPGTAPKCSLRRSLC